MGVIALPDCGRYVHLISINGGGGGGVLDYAPALLVPPSRFSDIPTALQNCIPDAHIYPYRFSLVLSIIVLSLSIFVSLYIFDFFYHNYLWRTNSKHV